MVLKKQHNTADTSRESYKDALRSGLIKREKETVLEYLNEHQPNTARAVWYGTGIEKSSVTRCLNNLVKDGRVKVAFIAECPVTERRVGHYTLVDWVAAPQHQQAA